MSFDRTIAASLENNNDALKIREAIDEVNKKYPDLKSLELNLDNDRPPLDWFPRKELWRLVIDGQYHHLEDPFVFDKSRKDIDAEPGYLLAMVKAFLLMEKLISLPLSIELIEALHEMAVSRVTFSESNAIQQLSAVPGLRGGNEKLNRNLVSRFGVSSKNVTVLGIQEALNSYSSIFCLKTMISMLGYNIVADVDRLNPNLFKDIVQAAQAQTRWGAKTVFTYMRYDVENSKQFIITKLKEFIQAYYNRLNIFKSFFWPDDLKQAGIIKEIVRFSHKCGLLHPFYDANIRTFVFLIVNKLLIENNFPPTILDDPNIFDFHSEDEICLEVIQGMEKSISLKNKEVDFTHVEFEAIKKIFQSSIPEAKQSNAPHECELVKRLDMIHALEKTNKLNEISFPIEENLGLEHTVLFLSALKIGDFKIVSRLLKSGLNALFENQDGIRPVLHAIEYGHESIIKVLVDDGANIHKEFSAYFSTLMNFAGEKGRSDAFLELIKQKNNGERPERMPGFTPLHLAVFFGHTSIVNYLLEKNADITKTTMGVSALDFAKVMNYEGIVKILEAQEQKNRFQAQVGKGYSPLFFSPATLVIDEDLNHKDKKFKRLT